MLALVHGVDLVEVERIAGMLESHGEPFVNRVFTHAEQEYAESGGSARAERYAARFAAKEAVLKAIGTGWAGGIAWTDVGVRHGSGGRPELELTGEAANVAQSQGITGWTLSLSHTAAMAMASVVGVVTGKEA